jgi:hypothetical protein
MVQAFKLVTVTHQILRQWECQQGQEQGQEQEQLVPGGPE